jgi:hypothetical protein
MQKRSFFAADPLAAIATALLGAVVVWRVSLSLFIPALPDPSLLRGALNGQAGRQVVLVASRGDEARAKGIASASPGLPRLPLRVVSLAPGSLPDARFERRVRSLLRAYGYPSLPVLVVLDDQGRVVKVSSL